MSSKNFKRFVCFLICFVQIFGMLPGISFASAGAGAAVSAESENVDMLVTAESGIITVKINKVGTSGKATLYRVAANQYAKGDTMSGKSTDIAATGTEIGTYTCGTTQEFRINRYLSDGSDNLYDKYYLIQNGSIICGPVYASEINSLRSKPPFETQTKKGVTLEDHTTIELAKEMGAGNTVINMNLSELIVATEDKNGNPRDLSHRSDLIPFESNGKTYYFKSDYIRLQDGLISAYSKAGMNVTLVIITWAKTLNDDYPTALKYFNQTGRQTLAYNTSNTRGMEYWVATMEFLADRYSQSENLGLIDKFIIGNEIDYTYDWYLMEPLVKNDQGHYYAIDFDVFMEEFARTFRLANLAVKKYNSEAKVCVSLTHNWALNSAEAYNAGKTSVRQNSYRPKEIIDWLVKYEGERGNYDWGLAVHPYAVGTNPSNPLKTDVAGTYGRPVTGDPDTTPWITVSNLEMYQLYLQRPENMYKGQVRTVSLTETTVLSENSSSSNYTKSVNEQAASIAATYYRAANIPCIDQIAYFQPHDQTTTSYMVGLMTSSGVKKPAYDVWKYIDTDKSFVYANKYLKYIFPDAKSYESLMPAVKSDYDWSLMWDEDNIINRKVEGGDSVRQLATNKSTYAADEKILVTAKGDLGDTVELFKSTDDISSATPLYSYPVVGTRGQIVFRSGSTYDILAYGEVASNRSADAALKAGSYKVVLRRGDNGQTIVKTITLSGNYSLGGTERFLMLDKTEYASGENIIVSASGNKDCWAGLYKKGDVYGAGKTTSIFWYYVNEPGNGHIPGKPTILQETIHNTDSSNPGMILSPGEYVVYLFDGSGGNTYNAVMSQSFVVTEADIAPLTGITYKLDNNTDGFANGTVTVTKNSDNIGAADCVMYWGDINGKPLEDYISLAKFKLTGATTEYRMPSHMIIPAEAKTLIAYASNGSSLSNKAVSVTLPANCGYKITGTPNTEFQVISDIHLTTDAGATNEVKDSNKHFTMMLNDVVANSPNSAGIFVSGDIANNGAANEYKKLVSLFYAVKGAPSLHLAVGNHDWYSGNPNKQFQYYAAMVNQSLSSQPENVYYDEVVNGYHYIYLGGEQNNLRAILSDAQLKWFDKRMAEITKEDPDRPVFVLLHQSFYNTVAGSLPGQGWDGVSNEDALKSIMQKYGQIILLNGHSHWILDSDSNMFPGDNWSPVAFNTASVSYMWTSYNVMGGEFAYGSQGYYFRVYDDKIVVLGRDFTNQKFVPSATYVIKRNEITGVEDEYDISIYQPAVSLDAKAAAGGMIRYASSNSDIAGITDDGVIIARKAGTAVITITAESTDTAVVAKKKIVVNINETKPSYTVTFKDWDGSVLSSKTYYLGDNVQIPADPTRQGTESVVYTFAGWDRPVEVCSGDAIYTARYTAKEINKLTVKRVFGSTRYDTAFKSADELKAVMGVDKFSAVVVANGTEFPDALAGSYLATQKDAPILLFRNRSIEMNALKAYIKENLTAGGTIYILGGTNAVPVSMEKGLENFTVKRLGGATRYDTNLLILKEAGVEDKDILVCTGLDFADSLSASACNLPILLVKNGLTAAQKQFLATTTGKKIIVGGVNAVSTTVEKQLGAYGEVERLNGNTRYDTSVLVAKRFFSSPEAAVVAYGMNFPDGLCGGPLANRMGGPLLLTRNQNAKTTKAYVQGEPIMKGIVLGGETLISNAAVTTIFGIAPGDNATAKTYGVTYVLNGGTNNSANPATYTKGKAIVLQDPTKAGYTFDGWYLDVDFKTNVTGITAGDVGDLVFYAKWSVNSYKINYVLDGGTNAADNPVKYTYGTAAMLKDAVKEGFVFAGWYLDSGLTEKTTAISSTNIGDVTLYAKWAKSEYGITYVLNGGTNASSNPATYNPGTAVALNDPSKSGFSFGGWYLDSSFVNRVTEISADRSGDIVLYAKWVGETYSITYVLDGGKNSASNPATYTAGTAINLQNPSKAYNTFAGWYLDSAFNTKITSISDSQTGKLTLYAKWEPYTYNITYELNKGENSASNPATYSYGTSFTLAEPTRENHTFYGWYLDSSFKTKVTSVSATDSGDIKLYAKWHLSQLNETGEGMENMIWSWWYYPQVVSTDDAVYWGYASNDGYSGVAKYDIATGKTTRTALKKLSTIDDHNGLGLTLLDDGRIMCVYAGGHDANYEMHIRISKSPYDISEFSTGIILTSVGKTCYGQLVKQDGKIYVFYRVNSKLWAYRYTENGRDWSDEVIMVSATMQYYCKVVPTTEEGLLRVCMYSNPTAEDPSIRMGFLDTETGMLYNSDRTTALGSERVSHEKFNVIIEKPEEKIQRMFDVAVTAPEEVRLLYTVFSNSKTANDSVYYLYDSGNTIQICAGGAPLWNPKYQGGASFAGNDCIVAARNENGKDYVEVYDYKNGVIMLNKSVWSEDVGTAGIRNARPIVDVNGKVFLWHNGFYSPNSYTNFDTDAKIEFLK